VDEKPIVDGDSHLRVVGRGFFIKRKTSVATTFGFAHGEGAGTRISDLPDGLI
jgi:hypothetical protein